MVRKYDILQWYSYFLKSGDVFSIKADAKKCNFDGDRLSVRTQAVEKALSWLREELK